MTIEFNGYTFALGCVAFPEQYDVYKDGIHVAYVHLRCGILTALDIGGTQIYYHESGDEYKGCFDSDEERDLYFKDITTALDIYRTDTSNDN